MRIADGELIWETNVGAPVYRTPAVSDGMVYVPTTRGRLIALDAGSGAERFLVDAGSREVRLTSPAVTEDVVVFATSDGLVTAADARTGSIRWTYENQEAISATPLISGNLVFFGDMVKRLRALDLETGDLIWETELEGRVKSAMAAAGGSLVVLAEPRHVYLFRAQPEYASNP